MMIGGKDAARARGKLVDIINRCCEGGRSLIPELERNATSNDPICVMARESTRHQREKLKSVDPAPAIPVQHDDPAPVVPVKREDPGPVDNSILGIVVGEKRSIDQGDENRELELEERRLRLVERKKALERQEIDHALVTYKMVASDAQFGQEMLAAVRERAMKIVMGMGSGGVDGSGM